jgi:hypothetical protein
MHISLISPSTLRAAIISRLNGTLMLNHRHDGLRRLTSHASRGIVTVAAAQRESHAASAGAADSVAALHQFACTPNESRSSRASGCHKHHSRSVASGETDQVVRATELLSRWLSLQQERLDRGAEAVRSPTG